MRRSFSETERSLAAEIRGLHAALLDEQQGRTAENTRWRHQFTKMVDFQEAMEARLADFLRLAEGAFALKRKPGKVGECAANSTVIVEQDTHTEEEEDPRTMEENEEEVDGEEVVDEEGDFSMTEEDMGI